MYVKNVIDGIVMIPFLRKHNPKQSYVCTIFRSEIIEIDQVLLILKLSIYYTATMECQSLNHKKSCNEKKKVIRPRFKYNASSR